jgi:uncharacterized membrane protein YoaK (UPF0700 family)
MKGLRIFWQEFKRAPRGLKLLAMIALIIFAVVEIIAILTYPDLAIMIPVFLVCFMFFLINFIVWDTGKKIKK